MLGNEEGFHLSRDLSLETGAGFADLEIAIDDDRTMNNGFAIAILHYCPLGSIPKKKNFFFLNKKRPSSPAWSCLPLSSSYFLEWKNEPISVIVQW